MFALADQLEVAGGLVFHNPFSSTPSLEESAVIPRNSDLDHSAWSTHFSTGPAAQMPFFYPQQSTPLPSSDSHSSPGAFARRVSHPDDLFSAPLPSQPVIRVSQESPQQQQPQQQQQQHQQQQQQPNTLGLDMLASDASTSQTSANLVPMLCMSTNVAIDPSSTSSTLPLYVRRRRNASCTGYVSDHGGSCSPQSSASLSTAASSFLEGSASPHDHNFTMKDTMHSFSPSIIPDQSLDLLFDSFGNSHSQCTHPGSMKSESPSQPTQQHLDFDDAHSLDQIHRRSESSASEAAYDIPSVGASYVTSKDAKSLMSSFNSRVSAGTQKKHKCPVCNKRFTRPSSLQTHIFSHTGEKPFQCDHHGCGRRFSVVSNLRRHRRIHRGMSA
ncbi:uncharacterized protein V2V93DRAFT_370818 [Kockiozyma suomiensis]|uniref:uncharacterized protein n=1 Tax=Kockiozyma suomiensis TaxID=1337062 RepID=UPI0033439BA7